MQFSHGILNRFNMAAIKTILYQISRKPFKLRIIIKAGKIWGVKM